MGFLFVDLGQPHNPMGGFNCTETPLPMVHQKLKLFEMQVQVMVNIFELQVQ